MLTKKTFEDSLHEAMRQKDETAKNTYKILLSSIKMLEIEKVLTADDAIISGIIQKEIKMRRESINEFQKGERGDLIKLAETEIALLEKFLPAQMSEEDIKKAVTEAIKEPGATLPSDMGKVMKVLIPKLAGQASADRISSAVRSSLS
ncbi:MAG: GatB/YqeY domain-containing protein [Anaerolineaceae bacterium]|nr:GatB/YqeY domain-containing protein [Anaerolineaceae bacterium]